MTKFDLQVLFGFIFILSIKTYVVRSSNCHYYKPPSTAEQGYPSFVKAAFKVEDQPEFKKIPLWTNAEVPYTFNVDSNDQAYLWSHFSHAIEQYHKHTCIRFVPHTDQKNKLNIVSKDNNYADVGMVGNTSTLSIVCDESPHYMSYKYLHDLGHVLGMDHEQQRFDRDNYISVDFDAVMPGLEYTYARKNLSTYIMPYDYNSFMHYSGDAFALPGKVVMKTKDPKYQKRIGQIFGLSQCDIVRLNTLYDCHQGYNKNPNDCLGDTFPQNTCEDMSDECQSHVMKGECHMYPGLYNLRLCMKSCNNCAKECVDSKDNSTFHFYCTNASPPCNDNQKDACPKTCDVCDQYMMN